MYRSTTSRLLQKQHCIITGKHSFGNVKRILFLLIVTKGELWGGRMIEASHRIHSLLPVTKLDIPQLWSLNSHALKCLPRPRHRSFWMWMPSSSWEVAQGFLYIYCSHDMLFISPILDGKYYERGKYCTLQQVKHEGKFFLIQNVFPKNLLYQHYLSTYSSVYMWYFNENI